MMHATKVLIADHSPATREVLEKMLSGWGYEPVLAADGAEAWEILHAEEGPRLAILDAHLTGIGATDLCRAMRAENRLSQPYLLLLAEKGPIEELVAGLDAGADDYITRPFHSMEFRARLEAGCRIVKLQDRLLCAHERLYEQATRDSLTGLWNRVAAMQILEREIARATRSKTSVAVIMADLDHFKEVNDTHGHLSGDALLREAAARMSSSLRSYDSIGRYGGEEFLVVIPGCHFRDSLVVAERLREAVGGQPFRIGESTCRITCSFGLAWTACIDGADANQLLREADSALYAAKKNGRNRVEAMAPQLAVAG